MALSNIFREPRREITETIVGAVLPVALLGGLYLFAAHEWAAGDRMCSSGCDSRAAYIAATMAFSLVLIILALGIIALGVISLIGAARGIHALGEVICNTLQARGLHLRPRRA